MRPSCEDFNDTDTSLTRSEEIEPRSLQPGISCSDVSKRQRNFVRPTKSTVITLTSHLSAIFRNPDLDVMKGALSQDSLFVAPA